MVAISQRNYWVVRLGKGSEFADVCHERKLISVGWRELDLDLSKYSDLDQKSFTEKIGGKLAKVISGKTEKSLEGGARQLFKFAALMKPGDVVMSPANSEGLRYFGIVKSAYYYAPADKDLPFRHRRDVEWVGTFDKSLFSEDLRNSSGSIMTVFSISSHGKEIDALISGATRDSIDRESGGVDLKEFGMESHLEDFLIENWNKIDELKSYEIYKEDGEEVGQQYVTDIGRIDILARSKDKKKWLIIELKKGKTSDDVVGQVLRYIGWVKKNEAENDEEVRGMVIAGEEDERLKYALSNLDFVELLTYEVSFLLKSVKL